ncbi:MAG: helix-turn-helix domain-containing protein [Candidatus Dormibacteraeota bacterium]|nr:helix-turn-helix domain-containing protein [Candidatus Dormibacteraeota bacterium]
MRGQSGGQRNSALRAHRIARGWTQDDGASALQELIEVLGESRPPLDGNLWGKWERGDRTPGRYYAPRLCLLFAVPPDWLGLRPSPRLLAEYRRLEQVVSINRRRFLQQTARTAAAGASVFLGGSEGVVARRSSAPSELLDGRTLDGLAALALDYSRRSHEVPPASLLPAVEHHLQHLRGLLDGSQISTHRRGLLTLAGRTAGLAGYLSFRCDNRGDARIQFGLAETLAREAGDGPALAFTLTARSVLCSAVPSGGVGGDTSMTLPLLDEAERRAGASAPFVRAWVHMRRADEHALAQNALASERDLLEADRWLARGRFEGDPFYGSAAGLVGYRASRAVLLRQPTEAIEAVETALASRTSTAASDQERSILVMLLGAAYAQRGEVEQACALLEESLGAAVDAGLRLRVQRVAGLRRRHLDGVRAASVRQLDEQLRAVA